MDEKMRHRLYCPVYDITSYLKEGENTIAFLMGPGWYEMPNECYEYGHIKLCYVIDWQDEKGEDTPGPAPTAATDGRKAM